MMPEEKTEWAPDLCEAIMRRRLGRVCRSGLAGCLKVPALGVQRMAYRLRHILN
jgi:hypothetical protein